MNYEYPENFARFYDTIYHQMRDGVDNDFFLNYVKNTKGNVLEIGVGTGRFFTDSLNSGADIYGIDISASMLEVLKSKLDVSQRYRVDRQNIVDFNFKFGFDLIIAPFRVLMHVLDKDGQLKALNNVYKHLNAGGMFIFDVFIPDLKPLISGLDNVTDFEGEYEQGKKIKRTVSTKPDLLNQIINVYFNLEWEEDDMIKTDNWHLPLRYYFRYELEHLVERSEFKTYKILGDYQGNPLNQSSKEFIVVCNK